MTGEALLAPWLKDLEFKNVKVPLPASHGLDAPQGGQWGQICGDVEIWLRGSRVTDVTMELQAFGEDYMIGTAASNVHAPLSDFRELGVVRDIYPTAGAG